MASPSGVRVFAKSLHLLAAGWLLSVLWLWVATVQQSFARQGAMPEGYGIGTLVSGGVSALVIEAAARALVRWSGSAPGRHLERREWHHAFWWSLVPNLLLLGTAYLMILSAV
jgi:hypothetical protein